MIPIRCHSLGLIMTEPRSIDPQYLVGEIAVIAKKKVKTEEDKAILQPYFDMSLSAGAKTELKGIAKEFVYGYHKVVTTKFMEKGIQVEDTSIELLNNVFYKDFKKNKIRKQDELLSGEIDIDDEAGDQIIDTKSSWDLSTFPAFVEDCHDPIYEWQMRGYMRLWKRSKATVAFTLVDTPEELIKYEQKDLHEVSHIPPHMRVTAIQYTRDMELERKIEVKVRAAQEFIANMVAQISLDHKHEEIMEAA